MTARKVFSSQEIAAFQRDGFLKVQRVCDPEVAVLCRSQLFSLLRESHSIDPSAPASYQQLPEGTFLSTAWVANPIRGSTPIVSSGPRRSLRRGTIRA